MSVDAQVPGIEGPVTDRRMVVANPALDPEPQEQMLELAHHPLGRQGGLDPGPGDSAVAHPEDPEEAGELVLRQAVHRVGDDLVLGQRPRHPIAAQQRFGHQRRQERQRCTRHLLRRLTRETTPKHRQRAHHLLLGHGLFGNGPDTVASLTNATGLGGFEFVTGGTNFSGLSSPDIAGDIQTTFIFKVIADVDKFGALPDRLRQGQLHTLVLARMMKRGLFNADPAFQVGGHGAIDPEQPLYYFGASLGGIMGTIQAP